MKEIKNEEGERMKKTDPSINDTSQIKTQEKNQAKIQANETAHVNAYSDARGMYALSALALLIMGYQMYKDIPSGDVLALLFSFLSVGAFTRYNMTKDKSFLWMGLFTGIICLGTLIWYVVQTW